MVRKLANSGPNFENIFIFEFGGFENNRYIAVNTRFYTYLDRRTTRAAIILKANF